MEDTDWMDKFDYRSVESPKTVHSSVLLTTKVRIELQGYQEAPSFSIQDFLNQNWNIFFQNKS